MSELNASALDCGTMFLQSIREDKDGKTLIYNTVRDCYRELPYAEEFEETLKAQGAQYVKGEGKLYVLGNDAYLQAGMAEFGAEMKPGHETDILKRPMKDGILNPDSPKMAMAILRELMRVCLEKEVGPARPGEILYFSIPADPVDSTINNAFHKMTAQKYLQSLGYDARPLGEGLAVIYAENPKMHTPDGPIPFTGIGISMGAGQCNFCLTERGIPLDEFSVARSGDWIDSNVARMTGQPRTKVLRVKEKKLDFNNIDKNDEIILALECYYEELINYVFGIFAKRFGSSKGSIDHPIDLVLSGGTACPKGFDQKVKVMLAKMSLPFEIREVRLAGGGDPDKMLKAVARGCYVRAKQAAKQAGKKAAQVKEALGEK